MLATVNICGTFLSTVSANPIGFLAGVFGVVAGLIHLSISWHKWKNEEGFTYSVCRGFGGNNLASWDYVRM